VSINPAIEAAFWSAVRVTFAGTMTPAATSSSNFSVAALKPHYSSPEVTFSTIRASLPAFCPIWRTGSSRARRTIWTPTDSSPGPLHTPKYLGHNSSKLVRFAIEFYP
jgi:hypothetical protein